MRVQGRGRSTLVAFVTMSCVVCVALLALRGGGHQTGKTQLEQAMTIHKAVEAHGLETVSAAIHVHLAGLTAAEKASIGRLSEAEKETLKGQIMLRAAEETLAKAAKDSKRQQSILKQKTMVQAKGSMLQANESNVTERENVGEFDLTAWLDSQPERHAPAWEDPDAHHFDLANYLKCQPVFDLSAWLRDSSESLKPGCPDIRLTDCAMTDFEDDDGNVEATHNCCKVEVKHQNEWGAICDDANEEDLAATTKVVCRAVGCKGSIRGVYGFGGSEGKIWMDDLKCIGNEVKLEACERRPWGEHNCDNSEDMGVCCTKGCEGWDVE